MFLLFFDKEFIEEALDELKELLETDTIDKINCNNFISYSDFEDEFSHNEIGEAQRMFMEEAKKYLSLNYPGKYAMWNDWAVHITTVELYREIMWKDSKYNKDYITIKENKDIIS